MTKRISMTYKKLSINNGKPYLVLTRKEKDSWLINGGSGSWNLVFTLQEREWLQTHWNLPKTNRLAYSLRPLDRLDFGHTLVILLFPLAVALEESIQCAFNPGALLHITHVPLQAVYGKLRTAEPHGHA
jgi:hypothetical protein